MPKMVSEIAQGQSYEFSAEESGIASRQVRVFRLIKSAPAEYVNVFQACNVYIGDQHPQDPMLYCESVSAQYEGDSRLVLLVTFNYRVSVQFEQSASGGGAGPDNLAKPPDIRPANWSISTSLVEVPAFSWRIADASKSGHPKGGWTSITNPAGDLYEGVSQTEGIITINVEQWEFQDPTRHAEWAGYVNENVITLGGLRMERRTVMFRGVQTKPEVEQYNNQVYRGWKANYEFLYRTNVCQISDMDADDVYKEVPIGWDRAQPLAGFNIINKAFASEAAAQAAKVEAGSLVLAKEESEDFGVRIKGWPNAISLAEGTANKKMRGMIMVADGKWPTQRTCAQPIPLNRDGSPRWHEAVPPVIVYRYQVQPETDFSRTFGLRLQN